MAMTNEERKEWIQSVDSALESIRPHLKVDGGNVEVVDVTDDFLVKIKWLGNCQSCNMSAFTMKAGIEQTIKHALPEIQAVEAIN